MRSQPPRETAPAESLVTGEIVIPAGTVVHGGTAHVRLEEVTRADHPAARVAETEIPGIRHPAPGALGDTVIPFALGGGSGGPEIDPAGDYSVRVWLDVDGDGQPGPGDLYSDQSYRVLTRGFGTTARVTLRG
jgi:hypothetical protein